MRSLEVIVSWIYPLITVALFIFCLINSKQNKGIKYLAIGFGIGSVTSLLWRLVSFLSVFSHFSSTTKLYEILGVINIFFYIGESTFFFIGISILAKNSNVTRFISGDYKEFIASKYATSSDFGNIGLYIFLLIMGIFLLVLGVYSGYQSRYSYSSDNLSILMCLAGAIIVISAHIYFVVVLYRVWEFSINESFRLNLSPSIETPGKAVGYLFIPFFNFYWIFLAYGKLSKDLRAIADAKGVITTMSGELGVILAILCIVSIIPVVGYFTSVIALVILPIFLNQAIVQSTIIAEVNHKSS